MTNKTNGGVWVACSERLPEERHGDTDGEVIVRDYSQPSVIVHYTIPLKRAAVGTHWLDTTIPIMTVAEHEAEVVNLKNEVERLRKLVTELSSGRWEDIYEGVKKGGNDGD